MGAPVTGYIPAYYAASVPLTAIQNSQTIAGVPAHNADGTVNLAAAVSN